VGGIVVTFCSCGFGAVVPGLGAELGGAVVVTLEEAPAWPATDNNSPNRQVHDKYGGSTDNISDLLQGAWVG